MTVFLDDCERIEGFLPALGYVLLALNDVGEIYDRVPVVGFLVTSGPKLVGNGSYVSTPTPITAMHRDIDNAALLRPDGRVEYIADECDFDSIVEFESYLKREIEKRERKAAEKTS